MSDEILEYQREAWNAQVEAGNEWTVPVTEEQIRRARAGEVDVVLTPLKKVPSAWFPTRLSGVEVMGLASAGGQQMPIFAAAGAKVTSFDNSPAQLEQDRRVAEREALLITTVQGDMANLGALADDSFDLVFHPASNCFAKDVRPVWRECYRVLRPGGALLAGFLNPAVFLFELKAYERGELVVKHSLPYSDDRDLSVEHLAELRAKKEPLCFGHTLEDQIGGQLAAGFVITDLYEDRYAAESEDALSNYMATFIATRAVKPS